jgi:hypothetical protein
MFRALPGIIDSVLQMAGTLPWSWRKLGKEMLCYVCVIRGTRPISVKKTFFSRWFKRRRKRAMDSRGSSISAWSFGYKDVLLRLAAAGVLKEWQSVII